MYTIYVGSGTYNEDITIDKIITLHGPNWLFHGDDPQRKEEAILTGVINVGCDDVKISGFTISNQTKFVQRSVITCFEYSNNILDGFNGEGYINSVDNNSNVIINDIVIDGNYCPNATGPRLFKFGTIRNLGFFNNKMISNDSSNNGVYDYILVQNCLYGDVLFSNNYFEGGQQSVFRMLGVGELTFNIRDNYFKDIKCTVIDTRQMIDEYRGNVTINIIHNTFDHAGYSWCCIRPRTANYNDNTLDVQVHYNAFINGCNSEELSDNYRYAENPTGDRQIYNMDNNYFEEVKASDLSNINIYDAAYSWANCYDSIEALEMGYLNSLNN